MKSNTIDLWAIPIDRYFEEGMKFYPLLDEGQRRRADAFVREELKVRYTISHGALRVILASYLNISPEKILYGYGTYQKPYLQDNLREIYFNLSHSGDIAVAAIAMGDEVGVDVERMKSDILEKNLEELIMTDRELVIYRDIPLQNRREAFFALWTHKEALLKLEGTGITDEMNRLNVPLSLLDEEGVVFFDGSPRYLLSYILDERYIVAVASKRKGFTLIDRSPENLLEYTLSTL